MRLTQPDAHAAPKTPSPLLSDELRARLLKPEVVNGSEILLRSLLLEGVECVFGYPGGAVLYIYDAMCNNPDFKHFLARHEQGAVHAADGYARSTGKVGVCIATSGPGATNLVTGIATAHMDSVPLVVITGNTPTTQIGTDAFQEADIVSITMPVTKHSYFVRDVKDLARTVREAFHVARTGRRGPVLIDIPKDVSLERATFSWPETVNIRGYHPTSSFDPSAVEALLDALAAASRPVLISGAGIGHADAADELLAFAEAVRAPVTTTFLGLGGFPSGHDLWMGMPGMHGTYTANTAIQEADLVVSLGSRFDDRVTMKLDGFAPHAKIGHVDVDPAEIGKNLRTDYPVVGDLKAVLRYAVGKARPAKSEAWLAEIEHRKRTRPLRYTDSETVLKPQWVIEMIDRLSPNDAVVTTDVGQHQMWVGQFYRFDRPRRLVSSGGFGTMGYGFPAAVGVAIGNPGTTVISINGDGGMQMCAQELAVCAIEGVPVKVAIINNEVLGMVRQWQEVIYEGRFSHIDLAGSPDFVKLAEAYGVKGLRATNKQEAEAAWQEALATPGPVVVDFLVPKEEGVYPMVQAGKTIDQMIFGDEEA